MSDDRTGVPEDQADKPLPVATSSMDYPTIFADAVWFATNLGGVVRIQFLENQLEPTNSPAPGLKARHVGTLAMPRIGFKNMVAYLNDMDRLFDELDAQDAS